MTTGPKTSLWTISSRLLHVGDDRRLHEEALVAVRAAAGEDGRLLRALEEAEDPLLLRLRDHGAHLGLVARHRVADLERLDLRHELLEQAVVDLRAGDHARAGGAVLARVPVAGEPDPGRDRLRVGVVEDDHRRLAAELEVDALERVGGGARDRLAGLDVAGERDEADVRVLDEPLPDRDAVAGDDLQHARRQHLLRELDEAEEGERRLLGRLQDLDVARRERGPHLPDRHHQRVVPGADARDDPERLAPDHGRVAGDVLARRTCPRGCGRRRRRSGGCPPRTASRRARPGAACRRSATRAAPAPPRARRARRRACAAARSGPSASCRASRGAPSSPPRRRGRRPRRRSAAPRRSSGRSRGRSPPSSRRRPRPSTRRRSGPDSSSSWCSSLPLPFVRPQESARTRPPRSPPPRCGGARRCLASAVAPVPRGSP